MNYGFIYLTTNCYNGKKYIGKHKRTQNPEDPDDSWYLGSGKLLLESIEGAKKYLGENWVNNYKREILCECISEEDLQEKEKYYIRLYDAVNNSEYYNITYDANPPILSGDKAPMKNPESLKKMLNSRKGYKFSDKRKEQYSMIRKALWKDEDFRSKEFANNPKMFGNKNGQNNPFYGKKHTEESRKRISESLEGRKHSEETRRKMSESRIGSSNGFYGKKHSEETIKYLSEINRGSNSPNYNKKWMINSSGNRVRVSSEQIDEYIRKGYILGFTYK